MLLLELSLNKQVLVVRLDEVLTLLSQELERVFNTHQVLWMLAKHVELADAGQQRA